MIKNILLVMLGGGTGSAFRYLISVYFFKSFTSNLPVATLFANTLGCLLVGFFAGLFLKNTDGESIRLLLITGFCGGFTTFSAFALENTNLIQSGNYLTAFAYTALSICLGLAFVYLGIFIAKLF